MPEPRRPQPDWPEPAPDPDDEPAHGPELTVAELRQRERERRDP